MAEIECRDWQAETSANETRKLHVKMQMTRVLLDLRMRLIDVLGQDPGDIEARAASIVQHLTARICEGLPVIKIAMRPFDPSGEGDGK